MHYRLEVYIYELEKGKRITPYPQVTHGFSGATKDEVTSLLHAHEETDEFLTAALDEKHYDGIDLEVRSALVQVP